MNPKYLKDKITVELESSYNYMKESINLIKVNKKWSNTFRVISDDKYEHAEQLYKIFMELYMDSRHQDTYINSIRDAVIETFAAKTRTIEDYRATYDLITEEPHIEEEQNERDITKPGDSEAV